AFAWLSQIVLFLMLGLLVTPSALVPILGPSLVVAALLTLVARPVAVALCLITFRYTAPEIAFISWVGLRGAVPIFLAIGSGPRRVSGRSDVFRRCVHC